jgi:4-hydroxyisophthalate hydroxylase
LSSGRNVYDELGPDFTLIALGASAAAQAFEHSATDLGIPLKIIRDTAADGREKYRAPLILVRPDQFVAWTGDTGEAAASVLRRVTGSAN